MTLPDVDALLRDIRQGERQRDRLLAIAKERRGWVASNLPASPGTVRALLEAAPDQEPRESLATARAALQMALDLREELVLEALVEVGNALRRCGDLRQAERALKVAGELRSITGIDPLASARYFSILASLRNVQRDYDGAIRAVRSAGGLYRRFGTLKAQTRTLVQEACIHTEHDRFSAAMESGDRALRAARTLGDRGLMRIAHGNMCFALVEMQLLTPAADMMELWSKLYAADAPPAELIRSRWLVARLELERGRVEGALSILREVCDDLAEAGYGWDYVVACLQLSLAHLELGQTRKVIAICTRLAPLCAAIGAPQPQLAAESLVETTSGLHRAIDQLRLLRPHLQREISHLDLWSHRPPH